MAWFGWLRRLFGASKPKKEDEKQTRYESIRSEAEEIAVKMRNISDRVDHLNDEQNTIMNQRDSVALEDLKLQFKGIYDDVLHHRMSINKMIHELESLESELNHPSIPEVRDELNEIVKSINTIIKHHKAVQYLEIPAEEPEDDKDLSKEDTGEKELEIDDALGSSKDLMDSVEEKKKEYSERSVNTTPNEGKTALESMQSQQTTLLKITEDMLKPPEETESKNTDIPDKTKE